MYAKVFTSLWNGSLRGQPDEQLVFIYLLAHADQDGVVDLIVDKIVDDTGMECDAVKAAIETLESPDPLSRQPGDDGRRLLPLYPHGAWGWRIVNFDHYRRLRNEEERRTQNREAKRRERTEAKSAPVSNSQRRSSMSAHTEADTEADTEAKERKVSARTLGRARSVFPSVNVDLVEAKLMTEHYLHPFKNLDRALLNWCKSALEKGIDLKTSPGEKDKDPWAEAYAKEKARGAS